MKIPPLCGFNIEDFMNLFNALKQLKSLQETFNKFKEELEKETVTYEDENFKIVSNLAGEILHLEIKNGECKTLEKELLKALKEVNRQTREKIKEKAQNSLMGSMGLF
ncbi:MAG: hypothetical protein DSZ31_05805 [Gammaproteobacteria bacterium]|nr:MAG: hypothetical protein DSZ31_05805 [Gammaproteobacteria bacterium]